ICLQYRARRDISRKCVPLSGRTGHDKKHYLTLRDEELGATSVFSPESCNGQNPVRIKICGITNAADSCLAARLGADAIGLNFYPQSPPYVDAETSEIVLRELPPFVEPV